MDLPPLSPEPRHFPSFCLSLSSTFLDRLSQLLPPESLVLSIGSGTGLLEAHIQRQRPDLRVEGVEVLVHRSSSTGATGSESLGISDVEASGPEVDISDDGKLHVTRVGQDAITVNRFLPATEVHAVKGTWELNERAREAEIWMFVYPRHPSLINKYLTDLGWAGLQKIIWLGPKVDWADYKPCFERHGTRIEVVEGEECGLVGYERMVITRMERHEGFKMP